jgi:hypothetical protein
MPARINNPRAADQLRREYSVLGDRLNMMLDDVVVPVAVVSDLTAGSSGIPVVRRAHASFYQGAVVAEYCVWRLEIPSGIICVIHKVVAVSGGNGLTRVHFGSTIPVPGNTAVSQMMDGRLRAMGILPAATLTYDTQVAALAVPHGYIQQSAAFGINSPVEWLFGRDDGFVDFVEFQTAAVNGAVTCGLEWDEFPIA